MDDPADEVTAHTLLNCLLREVTTGREVDGHLVLRLPATDRTIRVRLRRASRTGANRFTGPAQVDTPAGWRHLGAQPLAAAIAAELTLRYGAPNEEFTTQVRASRDLIRHCLANRPAEIETTLSLGGGGDPIDAYLASEQALVFGHRFHPTPKARSGSLASAVRYAPEAGARFPLRLLGVRADVVAGDSVAGDSVAGGAVGGGGTAALLDRLGAAPAGYLVLPVHPWQFELAGGSRALAVALRRGEVLDLGASGPAVVPTASVRTVYHPGVRAFLKLSLSVRITNCVRRNAGYELVGAVALTRLLRPVAADLADRFPGFVLLPEPAYRGVARPGLLDTFGVIVRDGLAGHLDPGVTPLLAAALADEHGALLPAVLGGRDPLDWWDRYVGLLLPPVLEAYVRYGVVTEPHLQNVVVGVAADGSPAQLFLRDLEGVKVLPHRLAAWREAAPGVLPEEVAAQVGYDPGRGFDRVVYCLLVSHLGELLARLADGHPALEDAGWRVVRRHLEPYAAEPRVRDLLAGAPLPAKANLRTRWARLPDRAAGYLPVPNPLTPEPATAASKAAP
jgi:siderophore synthetase component